MPEMPALKSHNNCLAGWRNGVARGGDGVAKSPPLRHPSPPRFATHTVTPTATTGRFYVLALLFMLGMLLTDGINGLWISRLIRRADEVAQIASRVMGLVVAGVSLLVAGFGVAKFLSPGVDAWSDGKELVFGALLVTIIASSYLFAVRLARRPALA